MSKLSIILVLIPEEPHIVYYCGRNEETGKSMFHEAVGLVKRMPLCEARKVFNSMGSTNKGITFCLMDWLTFVNVYQFTANSKDSFIKNSIKTK